MIGLRLIVLALLLCSLTVKAAESRQQEFFRTHGLVLFYSSHCPHCRQFAPVLKKWTEHHHAQLLPLSFDNQALPEFPHFLPASTEWVSAAFQGNEINYPAVFIVNPETKALYPVGFGAMSDNELDERMALLIPKVNAYEKGGRV